MPTAFRPPLAIAALTLLSVLLAGCGPFMANSLGSDPCLLQSYQGHSAGNLSGIQGAVSTLSGRLDALQGPHYTISASGDISETLSAISEFQITIGKQLNYLNYGVPAPPEAKPYLDDVHKAIPQLNTGAYMLAQAYVDAYAGNTRAAQDIADAARVYMRQGRLLLDQAGRALGALRTDSVNC